jgi:hypothetical protein
VISRYEHVEIGHQALGGIEIQTRKEMGRTPAKPASAVPQPSPTSRPMLTSREILFAVAAVSVATLLLAIVAGLVF